MRRGSYTSPAPIKSLLAWVFYGNLYSGMRGMLASVFLLGTVPSCLFSFLICILAEVISFVALTNSVIWEGISEMFVEWFLTPVNVHRRLGVLSINLT